MPNIKSAVKRVSIITKKTAYNKMQKSRIRTVLKKTRAAIAASSEQATDLVRNAQVVVDKAAGKGYMHKNTAARRKSRLAKQLAKMKS